MKTINNNQSFLSSHAQKTFIILGVGAYFIQIVQLIGIAAGFYRHGVKLSQFTLFIGETIFLPWILFCLALLIAHGVSRGERVFKAVAAATVGLMLWTLFVQFFNRYIQIQLPYGNTNWYSPWQELIPSVAVVIVFGLVVLLIRHTKRLSLTTARLVATVIVYCAFGFEAFLGLKDEVHYYGGLYLHTAVPPLVYYAVPALLLLVMGVANYLAVTSKQQPWRTRLYVSMFYVMMAGFIFTIVGTLYVLTSRYQVAPFFTSNMSLAISIISLALYVGVVVWHKRRQVS